MESSGPTFVRAKNSEDSLARLLAGTVDYVLMDDLVVQYIVDTNAKEAQTSDKAGATEPRRAYSIASSVESAGAAAGTTIESTKPRFYVGGNIYRDWASVPDRYKTTSAGMPPDPSRATASLFRFSW